MFRSAMDLHGLASVSSVGELATTVVAVVG